MTNSLFLSPILAQAPRTERIEQHVELARWSAGNALLIGGIITAAALYLVAWMYRHESRGLVSRRLRWMLIGCRVAALVLLGFIGLEPVLVNYVHRRQDAYTLVLVDESASMSLADKYRRAEDSRRVESLIGPVPREGVTRAALETRLLENDSHRWLDALATKNGVKFFTFSDHLEFKGLTSGGSDQPATRPAEDTRREGPALTLHPSGLATDVGQAIRGAIDSLAGAPAAAVVLLSDGGFNQGESPSIVAQMLKQKGVPAYAVSVGDPAPPINVSVVEVSAPRSAFKNDPFSVTVRLAAEGVVDQPIKIELLERTAGTDSGGASSAQLVDSRTVQPGAGGRIEPVVFERKVSRPGAVSYIARALPLPYEAVESDNQREILPAVQILDDKMRVLVVAGAPTYDYRFLVRMLERDATVDVSTWLQSADVSAVRDGTTVITELPSQGEELFKYDAIILLDCDPNELEPTWGSLVAEFVAEHGGGVLYGAGNKYTGRFLRSPKAASLVEILPVVPDTDAEILINEQGHYQTKAWPLVIPDQALADPILRLSDNLAENRANWSGLEGAYWHYPVRREKPVASVLMRHSDPRMANSFGAHVLLATQYVGTGRTAWLGFNSTWRWRRADERLFNRFWIQMLRFLVEGKLLGGRSRGLILTPRDQYAQGESIAVSVRALDEHFRPLLLPELQVQVTRTSTSQPAEHAEDSSSASTIHLTAVPGRDGYYQGRFVAERVGRLQLSLNLPAPASAPAANAPDRPVTKDILISPPDIEMHNTAMNRAALSRLAEASGGRCFEIDEAMKIAQAIPDRGQTFIHRERPRALWDRSYTLAALVGLLSVEWILRKKAKLL